MSSVRIVTVARPRNFANRLLRRLAVRFVGRNVTSPEPDTSNSTAEPGARPRKSRTFFGMVTCPFDVTVVDMVIPYVNEVLLYHRYPRLARNAASIEPTNSVQRIDLPGAIC
jgi:hypothetical protein